jgi:hypothetical protein
LLADQPLERGDARLVRLQQVGGLRVVVELPGLALADPDPNQVAREIVAFG